jgi:hydroxypyruvate reductase
MGEGDRVLVLLSGGASALLAEPAHGLPLGQKVRLVERLAAAGADIATLNLVRRHLSRVKGGRLARAAAPAHVDVWLASDVVEPAGLPVEVQVGSGPFAADPTTVDDARAALATAGITTTVRFDESVKHVANARHRVLVDNGAARRAVAEVAAARGLAARIVERAVTGDAEEAARRLVEVGAGLAPGTLLVAGGETTVRLPRPCPPPGGRAQHFALAAALALEAAGARGTVLAAGTDGRDGTTEAMGACVDETTAAAVRAAGLDPEVCLRERRAHEALRAAGGLLAARATGQNVADLYLLLIR